MYKNFDDYIREYSNDIKTFSNKVAIATNENIDLPYFNVVRSDFDLKENFSIPIIVSGDFAPKSSQIYESYALTYNYGDIPCIDSVFEDFSSSTFVPRVVNNIRDIKNIKFPIIASGKKGSDEYKTLGKLRSSERLYSKFREKPIAKTNFTILAFKDKPISITENIHRYELDVDDKRFKYLNEAKQIISQMYEKYSNLDFYNVEIIESVDGVIYINGINKKLNPNPHQAKKIYETVYRDYYGSRIPNWAKTEIFNESVVPYYKKKALDSKLRTSEHSIDYSKYLK